MKKILVFILIFVILSLSACSAPADKVIESLGEYKSKDFFTSRGFQDYTDYAKYTYEDVDLSENEYFNKISSDSLEALNNHIEDFEKWILTIKEDDHENEIVVEYDFNPSIISEKDYVYIYDDPDYSELGCYDVYFLIWKVWHFTIFTIIFKPEL